jgi:hypothetical protein
MSSRTVTATLIATIAALAPAVGPAIVRAGSYHVYTCRTPEGEVAPADGWGGAKTGTYTYAEDTCADPGGALIAALGDQAARTANTDDAEWTFTAPVESTIAGAVLWRAGDADGGAAANATYQFWLAGPSETAIYDECVAALGCTTQGLIGDPSSPENRVVVPGEAFGTHLYAKASCGGVNEFKCKEGQHDPNGYAAVVYLYAADITLEQGVGPSVGSVGGELAGAASVSGTSDVAFAATDPGAGVYEAVFAIDGSVVQRTPLDENGGRCHDVGETTDGLPAFLYVQPCMRSVSADVGLDTTRVPNGAHHLVVSVLDAAGNGATVLDRTVTIANASAAAAGASGVVGGALGQPNGTNASAPALLRLAWKGARGTRLVSAYGHAHAVLGRLTTPSGLPISGARLEVLETPTSTGAASQAGGSPLTGPDGRFTLRVPTGASSRILRVLYRAHVGDAVPAASGALRLVVRAGVSLTVAPRISGVGRSIFFRGRALGGPVPAGGKLLVLEARSAGGRWLKFDVLRSDRRGRFHASYRFRFPGPVTYQFRAVSEMEGDYPYAAGSSRPVTVREL